MWISEDTGKHSVLIGSKKSETVNMQMRCMFASTLQFCPGSFTQTCCHLPTQRPEISETVQNQPNAWVTSVSPIYGSLKEFFPELQLLASSLRLWDIPVLHTGLFVPYTFFDWWVVKTCQKLIFLVFCHKGSLKWSASGRSSQVLVSHPTTSVDLAPHQSPLSRRHWPCFHHVSYDCADYAI